MFKKAVKEHEFFAQICCLKLNKLITTTTTRRERVREKEMKLKFILRINYENISFRFGIWHVLKLFTFKLNKVKTLE